MTSAFGGQHSIQLSYGCVGRRDAGTGRLQHGASGLNPECADDDRMAATNHRQGRPPASSSAMRDRPKKNAVGRSRPTAPSCRRRS